MWLEVAKQLPLGHKKRMPHDCGEGRDMIVSHSENGFSAYCFRCGNVGFEGHGYQNLAEIERLRELNSLATETQSHELPTDFTLDIPDDHVLWLAHASISPARARAAGFGWSPRYSRIILPLYGPSGDLLYWQGRAVVKGQVPKYTNPPVSKTSLLYWVHPANERQGKGRVVVTEDILSATRVGKHCTAASLLGTKTSDQQAASLCGYSEVVYWLDPDKAGREGNRAGRRKLGLVTTTSEIVSEADPKNLSDRRIRELLGLQPSHTYEVY